MFLWRPIIAKIATLKEIEEHWSLVDLINAHEVLDVQDDAERYAMKKDTK